MDNKEVHKEHIKEKMFHLPDANITLYENVFSQEESDQLYNSLLNTILWQQDDITLFGKAYKVPRLTALCGDANKPYAYSGIVMQPHPWNKALLYIKSCIEKFSGITFTSCLLNYYRDGKDSNGWHQDNEKELGKNPIIGSVSFGETRPFKLKHINNKKLSTVSIPLTHGSFLLMKGPTQHYWKHAIPKTVKPIKPRINLTFRVIYP